MNDDGRSTKKTNRMMSNKSHMRGVTATKPFSRSKGAKTQKNTKKNIFFKKDSFSLSNSFRGF